MSDNLSLRKIIKKDKKTGKEEDEEKSKPVVSPLEMTVTREDETEDKLTKNMTKNDDQNGKKEFAEVDYAILKSITYDFKSVTQISKTLQIRAAIIEKHIFLLIKNGFIKYFQYCALTSKGKDAIAEFERNNPEDIWKPIDDFIVSVVERNKENKLKLQKMIDTALLIFLIVLVILIIYFGLLS